jgi:hypothetical protein
VPATTVVFYRDDKDRVPVLDWLKRLQQEDRKAYAKCVVRIRRLAEEGHDLRRPEADYLRDGISELRAKGPTKNNYPFWDADPSRLAALLVGHISRYYSLLAPCQKGASTPENGKLFLAGP